MKIIYIRVIDFKLVKLGDKLWLDTILYLTINDEYN